MPAVVFASFGPAPERQNKTYLHHSLTPSSCLYLRFFAFLYCVLLDYTFYHSPNHLLKVECISQIFPAIFFLSETSNFLLTPYTLYSPIILFIALLCFIVLLYGLFFSYTIGEGRVSLPECSCYFLFIRHIKLFIVFLYILLLSYMLYSSPNSFQDVGPSPHPDLDHARLFRHHLVQLLSKLFITTLKSFTIVLSKFSIARYYRNTQSHVLSIVSGKRICGVALSWVIHLFPICLHRLFQTRPDPKTRTQSPNVNVAIMINQI